MGRRRRYSVDDVVLVARPVFMAIVDYDSDATSRNYVCVQASDSQGRRPHGPLLRLGARDIIAATGSTSKTPGRIYRKRLRLDMDDPHMTGCSCLCGVHWCGVEPEPGE